jgi:two-component system chemotaxis response regulator CheB
MLVEEGVIRLSHGAKEHHTRPAIDPMFRSVALAYGPHAIGVILTGWGEDGTAGLQAIKSCGGFTLVQQPADAEQPDMPLSAVAYAPVDRLFHLGSFAQELAAAIATLPRHALPVAQPRALVHEQQAFLMKGNSMDHLNAIGTPSSFVCPDCNGGLWELRDSKPRRFRCHTGHAFTLRTLQEAQSEATDTAMWNAMRGLEEKEMLLRAVANQYLEEGNAEEAARLQVAAHSVASRVTLLRNLIEREESPDLGARQGTG